MKPEIYKIYVNLRHGPNPVITVRGRGPLGMILQQGGLALSKKAVRTEVEQIFKDWEEFDEGEFFTSTYARADVAKTGMGEQADKELE